ncbi:MAG: hypothetical protein V2A79_19420 [Planctomycetota bacterium]
MALVCCFAACTASVRPGGGGVAIDFTIGGATFTINFGGQAVFDVVADGPAVEKAFAVRLFTDAPDDRPAEAVLLLSPDDITFTPAPSTNKVQPTLQTPAVVTVVDIAVYMADAATANPCQHGIYVGTFHCELADEDEEVITEPNGELLWGSAMDAARSGIFNVCFQVSASRMGRFMLGEMQVRFSETQTSANDNSQNANGNANLNENAADNDNVGGNANDNGGGNANDNAPDNANDNVADNANDNTADNANDNNGPPVDPRDPDGDGTFEASACDALDAVVLIPGEPELSENGARCDADAYFQNISSRNVSVYFRNVCDNCNPYGWDSWGSDDVAAGETTGASYDAVYVAYTWGDGQRHVRYIAEIAAMWADEDYANGCYWIRSTLPDVDPQEGLAELRHRFVEGVRPCE